MRHDLADDPAVIGIACATKLDEFSVIGRLHKVWSWADRHTVDGNAPSVTVFWLNEFVRCDGFAQAMIKEKWLAETKGGEGGLQIPKFDEYISESSKRRGLTSRRARKFRSKSNAPSVTEIKNSNAPSVTKSAPREEKRREEKKGGTSVPPRRAAAEKITPAEFVQAWNEMAGGSESIPPVDGLTDKETESLRQRNKKPPWRDQWRSGLERIRGSPFCNGHGERDWTADPEFFLRPAALTKILRGKYDGTTIDRRGAKKQRGYFPGNVEPDSEVCGA